MEFNYDERFFRSVSNTPNGEAGSQTVSHYSQSRASTSLPPKATIAAPATRFTGRRARR